MKPFAITLITITALLSFAGAQTASVHNHPNSVTSIKGSEHPELISDTLAIRLFAIVAAPDENDDSDAIDRKANNLLRVQLTSTDTDALTFQLAKFKKEFKTFTDDYNRKVQALIRAGGDATESYKTFVIRKEQMSKKLQTDVQQSLSPEGAARFDRFLQIEKTHMAISAQ